MTDQVSRSRHGHASRPRDDFYRTPPEATRALLAREKFPGRVWEPACGDGAIVVVLRRAGYRVAASDLRDRGCGQVRDFLSARLSAGVRSIVTNPPYLLAEQFALRALELRVDKVALLCRLLWLEGAGRRRRLFGPHPPARVYVFSQRIRMQRGDVRHHEDGKMTAFAWFVWCRRHRGETVIRWLDREIM